MQTKFELNRIGTSQIEDLARSVFLTEVSFSGLQECLKVETGERSVRVTYSSFESSDMSVDVTGIRLDLRLYTGELWIGNLYVAKPSRLLGLGRRLVQAAEIIAYEARMDVLNLFPLRASEPFWAKLDYVPHRFTAKVLSKPSGYCNSVPCLENTPSLGL